jgi:hypothetical protein
MARRFAWATAAIVLATVFFLAATSNHFYAATSPQHIGQRIFGEESAALGDPFGLSLHVMLRKLYSIIAFAVVGFATLRAFSAPRRATVPTMLIVAAYSGAIELGQYVHGIREGLGSNTFDVACGAAGGWLGAAAPWSRIFLSKSVPRTTESSSNQAVTR